MKKIYFLLMTIAAAIGFSSCGDNWEPQDASKDGTGEVSLASMGVEVSVAENVVSRSSVDLSNFIVTIYQGDKKVEQWDYKSMPEIFALPVGQYKVEVKSHNVEKAAWDAPLYLGEKEFEIKNGEITNVGVVVCEFKNIRVSILFSDALKAKMGDDVTVTVVANDEGRLVFGKDETRSGYFEALEGSSTLVATFEGSIEGEAEPVVLTKIYDNVTAGNHYRIKFTLKSGDSDMPDETGGISLNSGLVLDGDISSEDVDGNVTIDEDVIGGDRPQEGEEDDPTPPGPDDPVVDDPISITSATISFDSDNTVDPSSPYVVVIEAKDGIAHLVVDISSDHAEFAGIIEEMGLQHFDLAYPESEEAVEQYEGLGFPVGDNVINKKKIDFVITDFVPLLANYKPGKHVFKITVTDSNNIQVSKTITFKTV